MTATSGRAAPGPPGSLGQPGLSPAVRAITRVTFRPLLAHARPSGPQLRLVRAAVDGSGRLLGGTPRLPVRTMTGPVPGECVVPGPPGAAPPPGVLVYLHGGGYVAGSPRAARSVAEALARRAGLPVLVPAYRRAPEHRFPAALDDALAVLRHLRASGVPAARTAVAGDSAGAHLAVGLTAALIRRGEPPPAALALFSPMLNPASAATLDGGAVARDPMLTPSFVLRCAQALADDADPGDPRVNPLACEDDTLAAFPPVLSLSGSTEYVAGDARELHERLARLGVRSEHRLVAGQVHGFVALHRLLAPARDAVHDGADFLAGALAASRSDPPLGAGAVRQITGDDMGTEPPGTRWYELDETGDAFLGDAPLRVCRATEIDAPPEAVWAVLGADDAVVSWSAAVTRAGWSTGPSRGVGSVRDVTLAGLLTVRERFYRWDAPRRQTFTAVRASRPGIRRFAEDYVVTPTPNGSRLTWTVAVETSRLPHLAGVVARPVLGRTIVTMLRAVRRQAERRADPGPRPER